MSFPLRGVLRPRRTAAVVVAVLAVGPLASCSLLDRDEPDLEAKPIDDTSASASPGEVAPGLERFYEQEVSWRECRETMECATLEVPLDYADPAGETISLSLLKVPATDGDQRIGSLVVNPGGPGASGVEYAARADSYFGKEVRAALDIVGFDPRGVGSSTPVDCLTDERLDVSVAADPDPDDQAEARQAAALIRELGRGCLSRSGDLARHMSTAEAARDIDVLRAVLGQERLAYFGASYGTFLGATYADLFPGRVGRMVLDGAVDPSLSETETSLVQAESFEVALRSYVTHCVKRDDCYLGSDVDEALRTIREFLDDLDATPIKGQGDRELTEGLAVLGIWAPLYDRDYWSALDAALSRALRGDGSVLVTFADAYVGRGPDGYIDNSAEAIYAVNCLDHNQGLTLRAARRLEPRFLEASPTFGRVFAFGLTSCRHWPVRTGKGPQELTAPGAPPIMVVGTSRDPATPLAWAEALADQLSSAVLVRRDGDGHTGYLAGNQCVDDAVEEYLVSGVVPDSTVDC